MATSQTGQPAGGSATTLGSGLGSGVGSGAGRGAGVRDGRCVTAMVTGGGCSGGSGAVVTGSATDSSGESGRTVGWGVASFARAALAFADPKSAGRVRLLNISPRLPANRRDANRP